LTKKGFCDEHNNSGYNNSGYNNSGYNNFQLSGNTSYSSFCSSSTLPITERRPS
jgi:hypothetical protein